MLEHLIKPKTGFGTAPVFLTAISTILGVRVLYVVAAILGAERIRRLSPYRRATSFALLRDRNPTFAVGRRASTPIDASSTVVSCDARGMDAF